MFPKRSMVGNEAISPRELFLGGKTDVKVECRVAFGEYVQAHEDLDVPNTMAERTIVLSFLDLLATYRDHTIY